MKSMKKNLGNFKVGDQVVVDVDLLKKNKVWANSPLYNYGVRTVTGCGSDYLHCGDDPADRFWNSKYFKSAKSHYLKKFRYALQSR